MSTFSEEVKSSLINSEFLYPEIELYGAITGRGNILTKDNRKLISITIISLSSMKRIYKICKLLFKQNMSSYVKVDKRLKLGRTGEILLDLNYVENVISKQNINIHKDEIPEVIKHDPVKFGSFLRGLFLTTGSVSMSSSYHLEFYSNLTQTYTNQLIDLFKNLLAVKANYIIRNKKIKLYIKSSTDIINILEIMNSIDSSRKLLDIIKIRELKGNVTRSINFITANANKTAESCSRQINNILLIDKYLGIDNLPDDLKRVAKCRLDKSDESLQDLSETLDLKKSTLYSKFKRIEKIAKEIKIKYKIN